MAGGGVGARSPPILVLCHTNHALDQFLEGILKFEPRVVRVGGRSQSEVCAQALRWQDCASPSPPFPILNTLCCPPFLLPPPLPSRGWSESEVDCNPRCALTAAAPIPPLTASRHPPPQPAYPSAPHLPSSPASPRAEGGPGRRTIAVRGTRSPHALFSPPAAYAHPSILHPPLP